MRYYKYSQSSYRLDTRSYRFKLLFKQIDIFTNKLTASQ